MAITTFDTLVTSIINWSHRTDLDLLIPDFIQLAETEMYANDDEVLEPRTIEKTSVANMTGPPSASRFIELPPNYLQQRDFRITARNSFLNLDYQVPEALIVKDNTGTPRNFTVTNQVEFDIVPDEAYLITMKFYAKAEALSITNQTNEILTTDPNIYLYGALHQLFTHTEDDNESGKWFAKFTGAIRGANKRAKAGRYGSAPQMKVRGPTP